MTERQKRDAVRVGDLGCECCGKELTYADYFDYQKRHRGSVAVGDWPLVHSTCAVAVYPTVAVTIEPEAV